MCTLCPREVCPSRLWLTLLIVLCVCVCVCVCVCGCRASDQPSPAGGGAGTPALRSSDSSVTTLSLPTRKLATSVFSDDDDATASVSPGGAGSSEGAASDRVRTPRGNGKRKKLRRHSSSGVARRLTSMLNPAKWWRHKKRQDDNMPVLRPRVAVSDRGEEPRTAGARRAVKSDGSHASAVRDTPIYSPV